MSDKSVIDWELGERLYRAGQLSNVMIAARIGCSEGALRKKAKRLDWKKDLSQRVAQQVRAGLVRASGTRPLTREPDPRTEAEIVCEAAATTIEVVRGQRSTLIRAKGISDRLFARLEEAIEHQSEIAETIAQTMDIAIENAGGPVKASLVARKGRMLRAIELPGHAATYRDLANAVEKFIRAERECWGLDATAPSDPDEALSDTELDRAITAAAADAGVGLAE